MSKHFQFLAQIKAFAERVEVGTELVGPDVSTEDRLMILQVFPQPPPNTYTRNHSLQLACGHDGIGLRYWYSTGAQPCRQLDLTLALLDLAIC